MAGPVYNCVWMFLCHLYPAYASFKAVKTKNVKEYVKCMMYWIVFSIFSAVESVLDPFGNIFIPFYSEAKVLILLYLSLPLSRGSGAVYRRWVHPLLCTKEQEIDLMLDQIQEKGADTAKVYLAKAAQCLGGFIVTTAVRGGGGLVQSLRNSYSLTDLSQSLEWSRGRFTDISEESRPGTRMDWAERSDTPSSVSSPGARRRMVGPVTRVLSSESISSGYMTDQYLPVDSETLDTGDYELWERVQQQEKMNFLQQQRKHYLTDPPPPQQQDQPNNYIHEDLQQQQQLQQQQKPSHHHNPAQRQRREKARAAQYVRSGSDDEGDTFYESHQTPLRSLSRPAARRPDLGGDQVMSPYPASEYSDWESEADRETLASGDSEAEAVTPTQRSGASLTMEELQAAATKLNMSLVTAPESVSPPAPSVNDKPNSFRPVEFPIVPPRQKTDLGSDEARGKSADNKDTFETKTTKLEETLKEGIEENRQNDGINPVASIKLENHLTLNEDDRNPFKDAMTESTETIKTEDNGCKPRSTKKVRAPLPPGAGSQSSLISATDSIVHLSQASPATKKRQITPTEPAELEKGKILYQSKGFADNSISIAKPIRVNIKEGYLEDQMLHTQQATDPVSVSNTFLKNQDFLQPLIKEKEAPPSNRSSGHFLDEDEHRPGVGDTPAIRETYPAMSPTRLFTYNASSGAIGLRKYDVPENGEFERAVSPSLRYRDIRPSSPVTWDRYNRPSSPVAGGRLRPSSPPMSERPGSPGSEVSSRCPHCTIHSWLPHSPGCLNRK